MLMRFLKRITHKSLKRNVISLVNKNLILINEKRFVDELHNYINLRIRNELENKREGEIWILATAAPMIYAQIIGGVYKFDYTLGTSMDTDSGNWTENLKEVKAKNVIDLTKKLNLLEINRLYTDHHDDIPLMKLVDKTILVNPSEKTVDLVKESGITNYEIIIDN
jgi:Phosphoserine phosphatase